MKTFVDNEQAEVRIEIIPLVDVVFCVLTFFILAAVGLTRSRGLGINLPQASSATPQFGEKFTVGVNAVGEISIDNAPITQDQLIQQLTDFRRAKPNGLIVIEADRLASYEKVLQTLDLLRALKIDKVALGSASPEPNNPPFNLNPNLPASPGTTSPTIPNLSPPTQPDSGVGVPPPGQPPLTPINPGNSNGTTGR